MTNLNQLVRNAHQRPDSRSSYPVVTWSVVRVEDGFAVATYATRKEALDRLAQENAKEA